MDFYVKVSEVVLVWNCADARHSASSPVSVAHPKTEIRQISEAHGSAIKRSVSFTILLGSAAMTANMMGER